MLILMVVSTPCSSLESPWQSVKNFLGLGTTTTTEAPPPPPPSDGSVPDPWDMYGGMYGDYGGYYDGDYDGDYGKGGRKDELK